MAITTLQRPIMYFTFLMCIIVLLQPTTCLSTCEKLIKESTDDEALTLEISKNMHDLKNESSQ